MIHSNRSVHREDIIINVYTTTKISEHMKQNPTELKGETKIFMFNSTI